MQNLRPDTRKTDVEDPTYLAWKNIYHPSPATTSSPGSSASAQADTTAATYTASVTSPPSYAATSTTETSPVSLTPSVVSTSSIKTSEEVLNELLVIPQIQPSKTQRKRKAVNEKAKEITDKAVL